MSNARVDMSTVICAVSAASRPRGKSVAPGAPQPVPVLLHISTVEPFRPTSCEYIGV
jgi:hypothetical protein